MSNTDVSIPLIWWMIWAPLVIVPWFDHRHPCVHELDCSRPPSLQLHQDNWMRNIPYVPDIVVMCTQCALRRISFLFPAEILVIDRPGLVIDFIGPCFPKVSTNRVQLVVEISSLLIVEFVCITEK